MAEYIDKQKLIEEAINLSGPQTGDGWDNWGVYSLIRRQPVVDAVPVVRCKDCIHWFDNGTDYCSCEVDALLREADHFCSYGERRDDNG